MDVALSTVIVSVASSIPWSASVGLHEIRIEIVGGLFAGLILDFCVSHVINTLGDLMMATSHVFRCCLLLIPAYTLGHLPALKPWLATLAWFSVSCPILSSSCSF